jgi:hypothetical protein
LIADRVEAGEVVDPEDIDLVLGFLRNVGCACFDHTARLILRPALERARNGIYVRRLRTVLACHETIRPLLDDTTADVEVFRSFFVRRPNRRTSKPLDTLTDETLETPVSLLDFFDEPDDEFPSCFLLHAKMLAKLIGNLIREEDEVFLNTAGDLLSDPDGRRKIQEFVDQERFVSAIALEHRSVLHQLEAKYAGIPCRAGLWD